MTDSNKADKIERQYTDFPYPAPIEEILDHISRGYAQGSSPDKIWPKLFPEKSYKDDLRVLIAGCGTNQAIYHALKFPNSYHYAIDVSEKSLEHVANSIKKYNIDNLEIDKKDIADLTNQNEFDYVISTGVIHHTEDPQNSLNKLVQATKQDGALFIMVYASYLRIGIYYLQDAFRYLGLNPNKEDIEIANKLIDLLPKDHYAHKYIAAIDKSSGTRDLTFDSGFIDTFFNARDRAYDIFELKELIEESGAFFQCWLDNSFYYRSLFNFSTQSRVYRNFNSLNPWELADFTQKISPNSGKLAFTLRKEKQHEHKYFNILDVTPETYAHPFLLTNIEKPDFSSQSGGVIGTKSLTVKLNIMERIVWDNLGQKLKDIFDKSKAEISDKKIDQDLSFDNLREMVHKFWKNGYINFSKTE